MWDILAVKSNEKEKNNAFTKKGVDHVEGKLGWIQDSQGCEY
jgi:hypothetical protein